ncbi:hypothetical protein [Staphylococcus shinii]|uniref:hypothetical protein n=1 Tax=Staphylococcus shinii TaxID=2912228 RepID=UPI003EF06FC4
MRNNKEILTYDEFFSRHDENIYLKRFEENKNTYKLTLLLVSLIFWLITITWGVYLIYKRNTFILKDYFKGAKKGQFIDDQDQLASDFTPTLRELDS